MPMVSWCHYLLSGETQWNQPTQFDFLIHFLTAHLSP
jgi:hypothetical protein